MQVQVQFFAQLRDAAGTSDLELDLPEHATVAHLLAKLFAEIPALKSWDGKILIGVGVEFVGRDYVLQPNETVAIMPPVQGG